MRRLSALDAWLLDLESATATGHVGVLVTVGTAGADGWGADQVRAVLEARLPRLDSLSQRLVSTPFGVAGRYLVENADFDLEFHLRELVLPAPGTTQQLAEQVAALHARPLDRDRPLWELHVLTGREGGGAAVYVKVHRTLIDEHAENGLLDALLGTEADPPSLGWDAEPTQMPGRSTTDLAREGLQALVSGPHELGYAVPDVLHRLGRAAGGTGLPGARLVTAAADVAGRMLRPGPAISAHGNLSAPRTRLDSTLTPHRRLAIGSVPMADVARVRDVEGADVDAVVLAMAAAAVRRWLLDHDALPMTPLVAAVPFPVRSGEEDDDAGVGVAPALVALPTHVRDVRALIAAARDGIADARQHLDVVAGPALEDLTAASPLRLPALAARAMSGLALAPGSFANLTVAHAPGPGTPVYLAGAAVESIVPVPALGPVTGGLAVTSYRLGDRLHLGLTACREIVPDLWRVLDYLTDALDELVNLPPGRRSE